MLRFTGLCFVLALAACTQRDFNKPNKPKTESSSKIDAPSYGGEETACIKSQKGCVQGFISHGMRITIEPKTEKPFKDVDGKDLVLSKFEFNDAQDFGDRFDTAFLMPLFGAQSVDKYQVKIAPAVTRNNFAQGFELYSEGISASDKVTMESEGNFILPNVVPYNDVAVRAVKKFRIEITKKEGVDAPNPPSNTICLEIDAQVNQLVVANGAIAPVGGLRNFDFYYTESPDLCNTTVIPSQAQSRSIPATQLPPAQPSLPK